MKESKLWKIFSKKINPPSISLGDFWFLLCFFDSITTFCDMGNPIPTSLQHPLYSGFHIIIMDVGVFLQLKHKPPKLNLIPQVPIFRFSHVLRFFADDFSSRLFFHCRSLLKFCISKLFRK